MKQDVTKLFRDMAYTRLARHSAILKEVSEIAPEQVHAVIASVAKEAAELEEILEAVECFGSQIFMTRGGE